MGASNRFAIVEAAWAMEADASGWMERLACALDDAVPELLAPTAFHAVVEEMEMRVLAAGAPPATSHMPIVLAAASQTPPRLIEHTRMQGATGLLVFRHADAPETGGLEQAAPALARLGGRDVLTIGTRDGRGETLCLTGAMPSRRPMRADEREAWEAVSMHLGAALRLRQRGIGDRIEDADLVFDGRGQLVYRNAWSGSSRAVPDATLEAVQGRLSAVDVAASRRSNEWMDAVFDGEWSVVARRGTSEGLHFLAVRNPVDAMPMRRLTASEVEAVRHLLRDAPAKAIADELGLTESGLTRRATAAYRKLGVRSRAECVLLMAALTAMARDGVVPPNVAVEAEGTESVLRIAWAVQALCAARGLTPAESMIVPLLITGERDAVIAEQRGVSRSTVANQTAAVYAKLGIGSRVELAHEMTRAMGLLPSSANEPVP